MMCVGKLCIEVTSADKIAFISEELCIGCGICAKASYAWLFGFLFMIGISCYQQLYLLKTYCNFFLNNNTYHKFFLNNGFMFHV